MDGADLKPALELATEFRLPLLNESEEYGLARAALLAAEIELRRHHERVAEQRRALPPGPKVIKNYRFIDENGQDIGLADLFGRHTTLLTYSWMFGPDRARPCPMCTAFVGPLAANANDLLENVSLVIIGGSSIERQNAFAVERGWRHLNFVQPLGDDFARDFQSKVPTPDGSRDGEIPAFAVFRKDGDEISLFWASQSRFEFADPGQDHRGSTDFAPLWMMLDLTPGGRPADWLAKLSYSP